MRQVAGCRGRLGRDLLSLCAGAAGQGLPGVHLHQSGPSARVGTHDRLSEPSERMGPRVVEPGRQTLSDDRAPSAIAFTFQVQAGPRDGRRPEHLGSLDGGSRHAACPARARLGARCRTSTRAVGKARRRCHAATDQQTLFAQNTAHSRPGSESRARRRSSPRSCPRNGSRCGSPASTSVRRTRSRRSYAYGAVEAQFDVGRLIAARRRTHGQRDGRPDLVGADALRSERRGRGRRPVPGGGRARWRGCSVAADRGAADNCRDIGPDPALNEFAAAAAVPAADRRRHHWTSTPPACLQGQHVVRILLEDAAGNRTTSSAR